MVSPRSGDSMSRGPLRWPEHAAIHRHRWTKLRRPAGPTFVRFLKIGKIVTTGKNCRSRPPGCHPPTAPHHWAAGSPNTPRTPRTKPTTQKPAISRQNRGLAVRITLVRNDFEGLRNDLRGLRNRFAGLRNRLRGLQNRFAGLPNRLRGLRNGFGDVRNCLGGLRRGLGGLRSFFEAVRSRWVRLPNSKAYHRGWPEPDMIKTVFRPRLSTSSVGHVRCLPMSRRSSAT